MTIASHRVLVLATRDVALLERLVSAAGYEPSTASSPVAALERIDAGRFDVVVADLEPASHRDFVRSHEARFPDVPLVALVAEHAGADADALQAGAAEAVTWTTASTALGPALERAFARSACGGAESPPPILVESTLLGGSSKMERVREQIERVGPGTATVLIRGETGTGKELVARALHERSERAHAPFIKTHLAALPDALLESELFGYEKGAFTGAGARKPGRVALAEGGTLFLDEIGEISALVQAKLLRLIQDREYEPLGGTRSLKADVRFVAATHRDLEHMAELGTFREDLFYRLNVVSVWLPPLRARREDIPLLLTTHARRLAEQTGRPCPEFDPTALALLCSQRWPGNVRQLLNLIERLVVLAPAPVIGATHVQAELTEQATFTTQSNHQAGPLELDGGAAARNAGPDGPSTIRPLREEVFRAERRALDKALEGAKGNRTLAARLLGVSRRTLYTKLAEHGLTE